jgi:hypothetical protein
MDNRRLRPVIIWSKMSECRYSTGIRGSWRFRPYVEGAKCTVIVATFPKANLRCFMTTSTMGRETISHFDFVIEHVEGRINPTMDPPGSLITRAKIS